MKRAESKTIQPKFSRRQCSEITKPSPFLELRQNCIDHLSCSRTIESKMVSIGLGWVWYTAAWGYCVLS